MSLPTSPPTVAESQLPVRLNAHGWPAFAVQGALGTAGFVVAKDGAFGPSSETALMRFQHKVGLAADGRCGPLTYAALTEAVCASVDKQVPRAPDGLSRGMALGEGGNNLAAVNWNISGGVDCGLWQFRCYTPFQLDSLRLAFSPRDAGIKAMRAFVTLRDSFLGKPWVGKSIERASRCAIMAHNWPTAGGADYIAVNGKCFNPDALCSWVQRKDGVSLVKFPDGTRVETRWQWCCFYAGFDRTHGQGPIPSAVTSWS